MATSAISRSGIVRPAAIQVAAAITVATTIVGNVFVLVAGPEGVSVGGLIIGAVSIALHLIGAWGLWNLRRWGAIMTFVVTVLDFLASIPLVTGEATDKALSAWFTATVAGFMLAHLVVLVLIALPASRRAVHRG